MAGGASLSAEVIGGIVQELTSQLRREEIGTRGPRCPRAARSNGSWPATACRWCSSRSWTCALERIVGSRGARPVPLAPAAAAERMVRRGRRACELGVRWSSPPSRQALAVLDRLPDDAYLSVNCSHHAAVSPDISRSLWSPTRPASCWRSPSTRRSRTTTGLFDALEAPFASTGPAIAIDDAGAGFASLRHTLQIAPDIVKMDISLTRDIDTDRAQAGARRRRWSPSPTRWTCTMVAEGIETRRRTRDAAATWG